MTYLRGSKKVLKTGKKVSTKMMDNKDLCELATGVMQETMHGPTPQNTVGELASGVIRLAAELEHKQQVFEELIVDRCALAELRDFWRSYYKRANLGEKRGIVQTSL